MQSAHLDFETASDLELSEVGVYRYVEHPSTRILCMSYTLPGAPEPVVWYPGQPLKQDLVFYVITRRMLCAWNDAFERTVWNSIGVRDHGFPPTLQEQWHNPQALAMQRNLPASLDGTAAALGL
jgi:DNA polymerase